jgi:hypothetical protein
MVPLENADLDQGVQIDAFPRFGRMDSLVVCVPDPGKRTQDRDDNRKICKYTHNQHRVVIVAVVDKDQDHPEYQPHEARGRASGVDSPKML